MARPSRSISEGGYDRPRRAGDARGRGPRPTDWSLGPLPQLRGQAVGRSARPQVGFAVVGAIASRGFLELVNRFAADLQAPGNHCGPEACEAVFESSDKRPDNAQARCPSSRRIVPNLRGKLTT